MHLRSLLYSLILVTVVYLLAAMGSGCAQISAPTGGPKDSTAPRLLSATPGLNNTNFTGNRITLNFDEYIEVKEVQSNVLVSPFPKNMPSIDYRFKTVTIKLKDTLLPNTTYVINFGNAIQDINEGNPYKELSYVFSTGAFIDSLSLQGRILLAETGKPDSTLFALLYRDADDSAVHKRKPDYLDRLSGDGSFNFNYLPAGNYRVYALKDGDGGKTYNSGTELFAFTEPIVVSTQTKPVGLFAFSTLKDNRGLSSPITKPETAAKKLRYTTTVPEQTQELLKALELNFNKPLRNVDQAKIRLTDTNYKVLPAIISTDSPRRNVLVNFQWKEDQNYRLILDTLAFIDSTGNRLSKIDTLFFSTKKESDYGTVLLRFSNLDLSRNPVLQLVQGDEIKMAYPLLTPTWSQKLIIPGEYEIRILYDENKNGKWDTGNYALKKQPEMVITLPQRFSIRANWDNERDIKL